MLPLSLKDTVCVINNKEMQSFSMCQAIIILEYNVTNEDGNESNQRLVLLNSTYFNDFQVKMNFVLSTDEMKIQLF